MLPTGILNSVTVKHWILQLQLSWGIEPECLRFRCLLSWTLFLLGKFRVFKYARKWRQDVGSQRAEGCSFFTWSSSSQTFEECSGAFSRQLLHVLSFWFSLPAPRLSCALLSNKTFVILTHCVRFGHVVFMAIPTFNITIGLFRFKFLSFICSAPTLPKYFTLSIETTTPVPLTFIPSHWWTHWPLFLQIPSLIALFWLQTNWSVRT